MHVHEFLPPMVLYVYEIRREDVMCIIVACTIRAFYPKGYFICHKRMMFIRGINRNRASAFALCTSTRVDALFEIIGVFKGV